MRSYVATPLDLDSSATAVMNTSVLLHRMSDATQDMKDLIEKDRMTGNSAEWLRVVSAPTKRLGHGRVPLLGFSLDDAFVIADAQLRCRDDDSKEKGLRCDGGSTMRDVWAPDVHSALESFVPALL